VTAPRIAPIVDPPEEVAALLAKTTVGGGRPQAIFRTLAHHPELLRRTNALGGLFMRSKLVAPRDREIVIVRTAWRTGSAYEFAQHRVIAERAGLSAEEVAALAGGAPATWSTRDQVLIDLVDDLCDGDSVEPATWDALIAVHEVDAALELLILVGFYRLLAGYLNAVGVVPDPGLDPSWPGTGPTSARGL
jgi:4-carboxymuconolactone decarboxylase